MRTLRPIFVQGRPLLCGQQIKREANIRNHILRLGHATIRIARKDIESTEKEITMETNIIIDELNVKASFDWEQEQKAYFAQQAIKNHARRTGRGVLNTERAIRRVKDTAKIGNFG